MIKIEGYNISEEIYNGSNTLIYKALRVKDKEPVVVKVLKNDYPSPEEIKQFSYEYEIACKLSGVEGIVKNYDIVPYRNSMTIIMEDFGGRDLDQIIEEEKLPVKLFLEIVLKIVVTLGEIHKNNIIHKDIKPHNIVVNLKSGVVKLIDFSISTGFAKEIQDVTGVEKLEGTLAYIAPEQTGRMNRSIDYRTDFYSLGVTFYQMLTGEVPFVSKDPMELVHSHIAITPKSPADVNAHIPLPVSNIIMKLMAKNAEDRYQSIAGLKHDLETCYKKLNTAGEIGDFTIAVNDISETFQIPEKLYGRKIEVAHIFEVFKKISSGSKEIVYFSGVSGIGKSALINEIHKPMVEKRGFFISGKYDQFKKSIPYTALIQAFQELTRELITQSEKKLKRWKEDILKALGNNGQVIIDVIPQIELIIGKQNPVQILPPNESQNRFNMVFQNFIRVFAAKSHPLILFLDDLQWADNASLNLIEVLLTDPELTYFLFFGAYRDNEVDSTHPFVTMCEKVKKAGLEWEDIKIKPLADTHIAALLADTLHRDVEKTEELAQVVHEKTGGNPFFVIEFLKQLYADRLINFDTAWQWDVEKIKKSGITDNVVELMAAKISKLPSHTLEALKAACCIGVKCNMNTLAAVYEKSEKECFEDLRGAFNEGMILQAGDDIKFVHDKVREATYSLISDQNKKEIHYKIGITILRHSEEHEIEERVFTIANQLNLSRELLDSSEKEILFDINFKAAVKAKSSSAYEAAVDYFRNSRQLLPETKWETDYKKTLALYVELADTEYLATQYKSAEKNLEELFSRAKTEGDKHKGYMTKCRILVAENKSDDAIDYGLEIMRKFGVKLPNKPSQLGIMPQLIKAMFALKKIPGEKLLNYRLLKKQNIKMAFDIFATLIAPIFYYRPNLAAYGSMKGVWLSLKYGFSEITSHQLSMYAVFMSALGMWGNTKKYGDLQLELAKKFGNPLMISWSHFIYAAIEFFPFSPAKLLEHNKEGLTYSLKVGDIESASYDILYRSIVLLESGNNLEEVKEKIDKLYPVMQKMKQKAALDPLKIYLQVCENLIAGEEHVETITGEYFDEEEFFSIEDNKINNNFRFLFAYPKVLIQYLFEKCKNSYSYIEDTDKNEMTFAAQPFYRGAKLFFALTYLSAYENESPKIKKMIIKKVKGYLGVFKKFLLYNYRANASKYFIILAELSRCLHSAVDVVIGYNKKKKPEKAKKEAPELYDMAIAMAREEGNLLEEAVANECAAKYYLAKGIKRAASAYMAESRYCYEKWGCIPKLEQLEEKYPELLTSLVPGQTAGINIMAGTVTATTKVTPTGSGTSTGQLLDIATIMKASNSISSEIELDKLLHKLIKIVIENAGAQKGILIFKDDKDRLIVEAEGATDKDEVSGGGRIPLDQCKNLSPAIVRYAAKTGETLVLDDVSREGTFTKDPYVIKKQPKSVICLPIVNQGKLTALLYLENNLSTGAFTPNRVETLKVLSTQAAISIENAKLVQNMTEQERLKKEMEIAERIQTSLVPPAPAHDELDIAVIMKPAEEVGGDYYDLAFDSDKNLWIAIGDVSGHGVTPGLIMMMAESLFNDFVQLKGCSADPKEAIISVNRILTENVRNRLGENYFMTMNFLKYTGEGAFVYAGAHVEIVVYRAKTKTCDVYKTEGIYLCIKEDIGSSTFLESLHLEIDDVLVLFTDGVTESRKIDSRNKLFGLEGVEKTVIANGDKDARAVLEAVAGRALLWCGNKPDDDITMVVCKRKK